jgi:hypothetical protein
MSVLDESLSSNLFTLTLKTTSSIRWNAKYQSIRAVYESFGEIIQSLDEIAVDFNHFDLDCRQQAQSISTNMVTFNFITYLVFMKNLMAMTNGVTTQFQAERLDLLTAGDLLARTIKLLETERSNETNLNNLITVAEKKASTYGTDADYEFSRKHRIRKRPKRFDDNPRTVHQLSRYVC